MFPWESKAIRPGPLNSPSVCLSVSTQELGAACSRGRKTGGLRSRKIRRALLAGSSAMRCTAASVSRGLRSPAGRAARNSLRQARGVPRTQPPTMFARVLKVASESVSGPLGGVEIACAAVPRAVTRLRTVRAALGRPGDVPATVTPRRKRASEYAAATVASSFTRRRRGSPSAGPATASSRTCRGRAEALPPEATT